MKASDIRKLTTEDLNTRVSQLKKELFELRFQQAVGQLENTARISYVRKLIAQMKTIIRE